MDKKWILLLGLVGSIGIILFRGQDYLFMQLMCGLIVMVCAILYFKTDKTFDIEESYNKFKKIYFSRGTPNLKLRGGNKERAYIRVQNAIKNGKIFVSQEEDGIYIRLAGNENEGEAYSEHKVKVYTYDR